MFDFTRDLGDTYPLEAILSHNGAPVDLTTATNVFIRIDATDLRTAAKIGGVTGGVRFTLEPTDVNRPTRPEEPKRIQWVVDWPTGRLSYPPGSYMTFAVVRGIGTRRLV